MTTEIIKLREHPELIDALSEWNSEKWGIPREAYHDSMLDCLSGAAVPQWYAAVNGGRIVGGIGVIENDFHERRDLKPNVAAVYVEDDMRGKGLAGIMLTAVVNDMADFGIDKLYLITDHIGFYERYGWKFLCMVREDSGSMARMYEHTGGNACRTDDH